MDPESSNGTRSGDTKSRLSSAEAVIRDRIIRQKYLEFVTHTKDPRIDVKQWLAEQWGLSVHTITNIIYSKPLNPSGRRGRKTNVAASAKHSGHRVLGDPGYMDISCPICGFRGSMVVQESTERRGNE